MNSNFKKIKLPSNKNSDWKVYLNQELKDIKNYDLEIISENLLLNTKDLKYIHSLCESNSQKILIIKSNIPETIVSASSLSLRSELLIEKNERKLTISKLPSQLNSISKKVFLHEGTIRAGEHIHSKGDLLVLGDVNPGAIVSANGNVMIWGKLLGIAHAGKSGNSKATISSLSLKPVQLRIADKVAKGPKETQELGIAEKAEISNGIIVIKPLCP